jgi:hypothetical protein
MCENIGKYFGIPILSSSFISSKRGYYGEAIQSSVKFRATDKTQINCGRENRADDVVFPCYGIRRSVYRAEGKCSKLDCSNSGRGDFAGVGRISI